MNIGEPRLSSRSRHPTGFDAPLLTYIGDDAKRCDKTRALRGWNGWDIFHAELTRFPFRSGARRCHVPTICYGKFLIHTYVYAYVGRSGPRSIGLTEASIHERDPLPYSYRGGRSSPPISKDQSSRRAIWLYS